MRKADGDMATSMKGCGRSVPGEQIGLYSGWTIRVDLMQIEVSVWDLVKAGLRIGLGLHCRLAGVR